jgi:transposase
VRNFALDIVATMPKRQSRISNTLWSQLDPLLPPPVGRDKSGKLATLSNRCAVEGILIALLDDVPWHKLPEDVTGIGGKSVWRRLRTWQRDGVWEKASALIVKELNLTGKAKDLVLSGRSGQSATHVRRTKAEVLRARAAGER